MPAQDDQAWTPFPELPELAAVEEVVPAVLTDMFEVRLAEAIYYPGANLRPFQLVGQISKVAGVEYMWLDGVSFDRPLLAPVAQLGAVRVMGTVGEFFEDRQEQVCELSMAGGAYESPTLLARACLLMEGTADQEPMDAYTALATARVIGHALIEIDQLDTLNISLAPGAPNARMTDTELDRHSGAVQRLGRS